VFLTQTGSALARIREERGLQQDALAHEADVHVTYLSGIENGRRNITLVVLERLAMSLGVSEADLVDRQ
jgi:transcriptional regulator with XRE-family HTH domain